MWKKHRRGVCPLLADRDGSASETEYQLILAHDLEFLTKDQHEKLHNEVEEVKRMLASLLKTIRADR